jgi:serine protease Do/serine protease DegQ
MYKKLSLFLLVTLLSASVTLTACAASPPITAYPPTAPGDNQPVPTLAPMLEKVTPAVVNISTESRVVLRRNPLLDDPFFRRFFDIPNMPRERRTQSLGSGVVVDAGRGYVITNHHVVEGADTIMVTLRDGRQSKAKLIGSDSATDIAVIQLPADNLTALPLANSDALRVGDYVVAIGNPFGLGQTVTSGIVSALGRSGLGIQGYENFIQTDASINPGNSGGALVNLRGELVGINTAILAPSGGNVGIGFAIPSNMVKQLLEQLVQYGEVKRGRLGVTVQDLTPELAKAFSIELNQGAVIAQVMPNSTADRAGLKAGDVVTAINDKPIHGSNDLRNAVGLLPVGDTVALNILRNGKPLTIRTTIGAFMPAAVTGKNINPRLAGAVFKEISPSSPLYGQVQGVLVDKVERGSAADRVGLRRNDVITGVNRQPVNDPQVLQQLAAKGGPLLLNIQRGDTELFLVLE